MQYTELAELIEKHKYEIARAAAQRASIAGLKAYSRFDELELTQRLIISIEAVQETIATSSSSLYREKLAHVTTRLLEKGFEVNDIRTLGDIIFAVMAQLLERELGSPANKELKDKFWQRLNATHTLGQVTVTMAQVKFDEAKRKASRNKESTE